ncbi:hypothetical protein D3C84_1197160 [compost metagenome]
MLFRKVVLKLRPQAVLDEPAGDTEDTDVPTPGGHDALDILRAFCLPVFLGADTECPSLGLRSLV